MRNLWAKLRPHLLSWHMIPCVVMLVVAGGIAIATGRPGGLVGAVGCMAMMMVMMRGMGGHDHVAHHHEPRGEEQPAYGRR